MRIAVIAAFACLALTACDSGSGPAPTTGAVSSYEADGPSGATSGTWTLDLQDSAGAVVVQFLDLRGRRYIVRTPEGGAVHPAVSTSGNRVEVGLVGGAASAVTVELSSDTAWAVQLSAGVSTLAVDAAHGTLASLTTLAGVGSIDVSAAAPRGLRTLREVGGTSDFDLHVPSGTGVQVHADGGAGSVTLFGARHTGIAGGATLATPGFGGDGYVIQAQAGISTIVVDSTGS